MAGDAFKVLERDTVLVGVPLIPLDVTAEITDIKARLDASEAKVANLEMRVAVLEARP